jgi:hypothetical protein
MSERAPYSRVYWSINSDPKFVNVIGNDAALALWLRLLMTADALWPAIAPLPRSARPKPLSVLIEAGLVDPVGTDFYCIRGLDAERGRRGAAAKRVPDGSQMGPKREANGNTDETRRDKTSTRHTEARDPADAYWSLTGRYPAGKTLAWIDDLLSKYGAEASIRAIVKAHTEDDATGTLLGRAQDILRAEARQLDRAEREDEQRRLAEKRAKPRVVEPWRQEFAESIAKQYEALS